MSFIELLGELPHHDNVEKPVPGEPFMMCTGCTGKVSFGYDAEGREISLHTLPFCPTFEKIEEPEELIAYAKAVLALNGVP